MIKSALSKTTFFKSTTVIISIFLNVLFTTHTLAHTPWEDAIPLMPINSSNSGGKYIFTYTTSHPISPDSALFHAKTSAFHKNNTNVYSEIANIKKPLWLYFKTDSFLSTETHLLVIENCNFNSITLYKYDGLSLKPIGVKGMGSPYKQDNLYPEQTSFIVAPNTIYFIEASDFYNMIFPIYVRTNTLNTKTAVLKNFFNGFYWGVITVMAIVSLFFFIRSKERAFIYYSFFLLGTIILNLCLEGYLFAYVWPNHPEVNFYKVSIYSLTSVTIPLFVYHFLDIKSYYPGTKFIYIILTSIFIIIAGMSFVGLYAQALYVLQATAFIQITTYIAYGIAIWKKGNKNALYFILAWSLYLCSILCATLSSLNIIPITSFMNNYVQIGALIQGGIFSFIMAGKYQQYKLTHVQSQQKIIDVLKERELLLTDQNDTLETTVFNRTQELNRTNNELNNLNAKLNELVSQKTWELQKSLEEIVSTNNQLKQFNYITSHNLRGPVSSLKGLIQLYMLEEDPNEKLIFIEKITLVINRMDEILVDLNKILSYRNTNSIKEPIDFETLISNNLKQLDISRIHVNLYIDPTLKIHGIKSFYESIFYNLLTNAQKYAHHERMLKISIQIVRLTDHQFSLTISDNGIGMDESKTGDKLFGFYKRFHTHVEGKGLGLYITKNQTEILGGTIRAESILDIGTTFIIELPC